MTWFQFDGQQVCDKKKTNRTSISYCASNLVLSLIVFFASVLSYLSLPFFHFSFYSFLLFLFVVCDNILHSSPRLCILFYPFSFVSRSLGGATIFNSIRCVGLWGAGMGGVYQWQDALQGAEQRQGLGPGQGWPSSQLAANLPRILL